MFVLVSIFGVFAAPVVALVWTVGWATAVTGTGRKLMSPVMWVMMTVVFFLLILAVTAVTYLIAAMVIVWFVNNIDGKTMNDAYRVARVWVWPLAIPLNLAAFFFLRRWGAYSFRYDAPSLVSHVEQDRPDDWRWGVNG